METVLKTVGLSKKYGSRYVVRGVNMKINKGDIYGFIGKNGAGKTTFMRVILGLSEPTEGSFELFGGISREEAGRKTGALIEAPGIYPNCTAKENMKRFALLKGADANSIDGILEFVGLGDVGNKKAGKFSLGMKQRLGIAVALLGDPEFLVLDEPVNGLDPTGIFEVRELLQRLNKDDGVTILISSHLLAELQKLATCYGVIEGGKLVKEMRQSDLEELCRPYIKVVVDDLKIALNVVVENYHAHDFEILPYNTLALYDLSKDIPQVAKMFSDANVTVLSINSCQGDLESTFISLMGGIKNEQ